MAVLIAQHSGRTLNQVTEDIDRDRFMSPTEAIEYGLIDSVLEPRGSSQTTNGGDAHA